MKEESANGSQKEEEKKEKKQTSDFGYDCNHYNGKNHLAKECMLKRLNEKKEGGDDETYHLRKLEEIKKKKNFDNSMSALIVQEKEVDDEFGRWKSGPRVLKMKRLAGLLMGEVSL